MDESRNDGLMHQAHTMLALGRHHEALQLAGMVALAEPTDAVVHCFMATGYVATGDVAEAFPHIQRGLELEPSWEWPHRLQAMALLRQAETASRRTARRLQKRAVVAARAAARLGPVIPEAQCILGFAELTLGRLAAARAAARRGVELAPADAAGWVVIALIEASDDQWPAAGYAAQRALSLDPDDEAAATVLETARRQLGGAAIPGPEPGLSRAS